MKIQCGWKTKNTVKLDGFVKCVGGLIAPYYVTQDMTH